MSLATPATPTALPIIASPARPAVDCDVLFDREAIAGVCGHGPIGVEPHPGGLTGLANLDLLGCERRFVGRGGRTLVARLSTLHAHDPADPASFDAGGYTITLVSGSGGTPALCDAKGRARLAGAISAALNTP